jgi:hypothetical protein
MAYGTISADVIQSSVANTSLGAGNASIMKNRLINSAMVIDQRNAGASVTPTNGQYIVDRWWVNATASSKFSIQQNAGSVPNGGSVLPPTGFTNWLGVTSSSAYSVGSGDIFAINQSIEGFNTLDLGWGTANAKTVTLSFQVYSSLTGTFGGAINNSANNYNYPFSYTISTANTWTQISVTITGPTSGTWLTNNGIGMTIYFGLGGGSGFSQPAGTWTTTAARTATGAVSVVGTNNATFYITGVQLEVGSSATGYEYRQYTTELQLCQRYYSTSTASNGNLVASGSLYCCTTFPVTMRASPTVTITAGTASGLTANTTGFYIQNNSASAAAFQWTSAIEL